MTKTLVDISKYNTVTHVENKHLTMSKRFTNYNVIPCRCHFFRLRLISHTFQNEKNNLIKL